MPGHGTPGTAVAPGGADRSGLAGLVRVFAAEEGERARVARDLHDQVGQSLTSVLLALRLADVALDGARPDLADARRQLADIRELVGDALRDVRELAFELRPSALDDLGLPAAVERLVERMAGREGLEVPLHLDGLDGAARLPADVETAA